jgi:hypothetical protein
MSAFAVNTRIPCRLVSARADMKALFALRVISSFALLACEHDPAGIAMPGRSMEVPRKVSSLAGAEVVMRGLNSPRGLAFGPLSATRPDRDSPIEWGGTLTQVACVRAGNARYTGRGPVGAQPAKSVSSQRKCRLAKLPSILQYSTNHWNTRVCEAGSGERSALFVMG